MTQPTKPTVPDAPLRSQPSTFSARIENSLVFWPTFATYLDEIGTYTQEQAAAALAAATAGDLPPITGQALNYIRVNAGETGVEFLTPVQVLTAIGAASTASVALKAPLASPALTGNPTSTTQTAGNNSTRIATTAFVEFATTELAIRTSLAEASAGEVGTYAFCTCAASTKPGFGDTVSASQIRVSNANGSSSSSPSLSGTWRCMGYTQGSATNFTGSQETSLFMRTA
jgi:hypothetical protein